MDISTETIIQLGIFFCGVIAIPYLRSIRKDISGLCSFKSAMEEFKKTTEYRLDDIEEKLDK